jgi:hypothetical protein
LLAGRYRFNVVGCQHNNGAVIVRADRDGDVIVGDNLDVAHRVGPALLIRVPLQIFVLNPPSVIMFD